MSYDNHLLRGYWAYLLFAGALALFDGSQVSAGDLGDLGRLASSDGDEYVHLRNSLLDQQAEPWNVCAAADHSWDFGLAAFILNERAAAREVFERWDKQEPRLYASGCWYKLNRSPHSGTASAITAFLLEKIWKGIPTEAHRKYAFETLTGIAKDTGVTVLWRAIWENSPDERLRYAALGRLCADSDPSVGPIIKEFLQGDDVLVAGYKVKGRCLAGLASNDSERAKDFVLDAWDHLKSQRYLQSAIGVLSTSSNPRARELMYAVAMDAAESMLTRRDTIARLSNLPQAGDRAFLKKFFTEVKSEQLKREVLSYIPQWFPLDMYRQPIREILRTSSDPKVVMPALGALVRGHKAPLPLRDAETGEWVFRRQGAKIEALDATAWEEDAELLEQLGARNDLPEELQVQIERYLAGMHELLRRFDNQSQPTDE